MIEKVNALAQDMASKPTASLRLTKRLMKMAQRTDLPDFLDVCAVYQGMCHQHPEHLEAVNTMLAKLTKLS